MVSKSCFEFYLSEELGKKNLPRMRQASASAASVAKGALLLWRLNKVVTSRERLHDMRYTQSRCQNKTYALLNTLFYRGP